VYVPDKTNGTPRVAGLFMKANKNWISDQIEKISQYLINEFVLLLVIYVQVILRSYYYYSLIYFISFYVYILNSSNL